jgi:hypothetical protein
MTRHHNKNQSDNRYVSYDVRVRSVLHPTSSEMRRMRNPFSPNPFAFFSGVNFHRDRIANLVVVRV